MILSEHKQIMGRLSYKAESSDDEYIVNPRKEKRPHSPRNAAPVVELEDVNDDDDERIARRKSRLLEPHPASANSPCATGTASRRRVDAAAPRGISQAQIGEHYGNCIRLAAENKITSKNAFNLHLIDYMSDMLKNEDYASFQVASSSLDAGAKIYAGRVDAVHQETYQVLTGLGRSDKPAADGSNVDADGLEQQGDNADQARQEQRKKAQSHRDILQKQLSKIRSKALAAKADVDPLLKHQTAAFNDGGTAELCLNQLYSLNECCMLLSDSSTCVLQAAEPVETGWLNIESIAEHFQPVLPKFFSQLNMCPSLQDFRFSDWDKTQGSPSSVRFSPVPADLLNSKVHESDDEFAELSMHQANESFDDEPPQLGVFSPTSDPIGEPVLCGTSGQHMVSEKGAVDVANSNIDNISSTADGELFVSSLKSMLDKHYEHYGQLNDHILGMWAGPEHWRKKAKRRKIDPVTGQEADADGDADENVETRTVDQSKKSRRLKRTIVATIIYQTCKEPSENRTRNGHLARKSWMKSELSEGPTSGVAANASVFKEAYRQKASKQMNLLPTEWSENRTAIYQLNHREVMLEPIISPTVSNNSSNPLSLRLDIPQDQNGDQVQIDYRPVIELGENGLVGMDNQFPGENDEPPCSPVCIGDDDDDDDLILPFDGILTQGTQLPTEFGVLGELDLIAQPSKVARIEIGYARTAKMINVRRLKSAMWTFLEGFLSLPILQPPHSPSIASTSSAPDAPSLPPSLSGDAAIDLPEPSILDMADLPVRNNVKSSIGSTFSSLIRSLPDKLSWQMTKELSIPIALNCLLHLSNEKELYIESVEDFTDLLISQGLPESELNSIKEYQSKSPDLDDAADAGLRKRHSKSDSAHPNRSKRCKSATLDSWLENSDLNIVQSPN